jgi:trk system potassium uptake protein TrkA
MFVVIAGGGRTGTQLATLLVAQNHEVRLIEQRREVLARIHHELPTEVIYEGHPLDLRVLEQAGIRQAQVLVTCVVNDEDNLVLCYLARTLYNVPRTIARINNPRTAWLFDQTFHVDVAFNQTDILAALIEEEMSIGDMLTLLKLRQGRYSLVEETLSEGDRVVGVPLQELEFPEHCVIAIIRQGEIMAFHNITSFEVGDEILALTDRPGAEQLAALFVPLGADNQRPEP